MERMLMAILVDPGRRACVDKVGFVIALDRPRGTAGVANATFLGPPRLGSDWLGTQTSVLLSA